MEHIAPQTEKNTINTDEELEKFATLPQLEYDRIRKTEAKRLGIRVITLDNEVESLRRANAEQQALDNDDTTETIPPYPDPVDGAELLDQISAKLTRHASLPPGASDAMALWILNTYVYKAFDILPKLLLTSPVMRCGKTTVLDLIGRCVHNPMFTTNITGPTLFRLIDMEEPTVLIDEGDTFINNSEALRGVINSGHCRTSAIVRRLEKGTPVNYNTFVPQVIAMIGEPASTIVDRSIKIPLQRKRRNEEKKRLRRNDPEFDQIKQKCLRWSQDNLECLSEQGEIRLDELGNDRAADNWEPLLTIAKLADKEWPTKANDAARKLTTGGSADDEPIEVQILEDIQKVFDASGKDRLRSKYISSQLGQSIDGPWGEWHGGRAITANQMARALKKFKIRPRAFREGTNTYKGYERRDFEDAFSRYVRSNESSGDTVTFRV